MISVTTLVLGLLFVFVSAALAWVFYRQRSEINWLTDVISEMDLFIIEKLPAAKLLAMDAKRGSSTYRRMARTLVQIEETIKYVDPSEWFRAQIRMQDQFNGELEEQTKEINTKVAQRAAAAKEAAGKRSKSTTQLDQGAAS